MGDWPCFVGWADCAKLPEFKQTQVKLLSSYYRNGKNLRMKLVYTKSGWIPTWQLAEERLQLESQDYVNVVFVVKVLEGSVLKRVEIAEKSRNTRLFLVTRWGLIELMYDYERGVYTTSTGIRIKDIDRRAFRN